MSKREAFPKIAAEDFRRLRFSHYLVLGYGVAITFNEPDREYERYVVDSKLADFLVSNCVCYRCGKDLSKDLSRCTCNPKWKLSVYVPPPFEKDVNLLFDAAQRKAKATKRKNSELAAGGQSTLEEERDLWKVQEGCCYYCGQYLDDGSGDPIFHVDHYLSISNGGGGGIENKVFSCVSCNCSKGSMRAEKFIAKKMKELSQESRNVLNRIHRRRRAWIAKLGL